MTFQVADDTIYRTRIYGEPEPVATVAQAADAVLRLSHGPMICDQFGHDFTLHVSHNMWVCFRCGEPGWEVPIQ